MRPAFDMGVAASRTPPPEQARLRSPGKHRGPGLGFYLGRAGKCAAARLRSAAARGRRRPQVLEAQQGGNGGSQYTGSSSSGSRAVRSSSSASRACRA
ncbi:hypothetical protein GPA19_11545 [Azoarcus indigens]|nr:hypothetical protein [Azoarcus indigens]